MVLIAINANEGRAGTPETDARLDAALAALPSDAPLLVMIHGYRFSPRVPGQSPHGHILSFTPDPRCWKARSWPRHLGATPDGPDLAIAFGWEARGSLWAAYAEAARAGAALGALLERIATRAPGRTVGLVAHSLGARVALAALTALRGPLTLRAVLMAAAEFRGPALRGLHAAPRAEVMNVTSRANGAYDLALRACLPRSGPTLGHGLPQAGRHWVDLSLDDTRALDALEGLGQSIARPGPRFCHWNAYLRPGIFGLYRAVLSGALPFAALRGALAHPTHRPHPQTRVKAPTGPHLSPSRAARPLPGARNVPS
ncbi:hypothetical protein U879_17300 [Defluviimonas sp. 20V17]|nr:hypothetical protein U879_17300 [Defluviimonas sp. 20V17]SDX04519.1 Alpha/beta hydrolase of unknown function [Allgaiera indica]